MDKTSLHQALEKLSENSRTLTVFKIIQRQIIIYIFYFTEVQVSRVIIVLLLRNCFVWCKDHTHQAILTTEQLPDECGHCTTRNSSVAIKQWLLVKPEPLWSYIYIADAPQSIESSALRNTFYSNNEWYIYIYPSRSLRVWLLSTVISRSVSIGDHTYHV